LLLIFSFFGIQIQNNASFTPVFVSEFCGLVFFIITQFSNIISLALLKLTFLLITLKTSLVQLFRFNSNFIFTTFGSTSPTKETYSATSQKVLDYSALKPTYNLTPEVITLSHSLSKVNLTLNKLYDSKRFDNFIQSLQDLNKTNLNPEYLLFEITSISNNYNYLWRPQQLFQNTNTFSSKMISANKAINLSLIDLNSINNNSFSLGLSHLNIYNNINQSKQNRWLLKNSLLSNTTTTNLYYFTQSKTLIGNTLYNSLNTSSNIWTSAKFSQFAKSSELLNLSTFQSLINKQTSLQNTDNVKLARWVPAGLKNLNFFENSNLWSTKKYFMTTQLRANTLKLSNLPNVNSLIDSNPSLDRSKLELLLNLHSYSLTHQLVRTHNSILNKTKRDSIQRHTY
jgi:hypothetical protein